MSGEPILPGDAGPPTWQDDPETVADVEDFLRDLDVPSPEAAASSPNGSVPRNALEFRGLADLCAEVDAAGPRRYLIRGIWPAAVYGVHAAEMKAGKTWNADDLAVSVASGTPWLGSIPVDDVGPVLIFAGEGGKASIVRRIRAICASRGLKAEELPIVVCARAPHLSSDEHLGLFADELERLQPRLVVLDPLYLAARGAKGSDLYAMGDLLEGAQHLCDQVRAALFVVTHYNRRKGDGPTRFTGAGPAEWGRVLIGAQVISRHTDPATLETAVTVDLEVIGGEVPDQTLRIRRTIRAEDPADLDSPLDYHVEVLPPEATVSDVDLAPAARKLLEALTAYDRPATNRELVDWIAEKHGHGLRRETVSRHLNALEKAGTVASYQEDLTSPTDPKWWRLTDVTAVTSRVTAQGGEAGVTAVTTPIGGHAERSQVTVTPSVPDGAPEWEKAWHTRRKLPHPVNDEVVNDGQASVDAETERPTDLTRDALEIKGGPDFEKPRPKDSDVAGGERNCEAFE